MSSAVLAGNHDAMRRCDFASVTEALVKIMSASDGSVGFDDFGGILGKMLCG